MVDRIKKSQSSFFDTPNIRAFSLSVDERISSKATTQVSTAAILSVPSHGNATAVLAMR
jgi:phage tail sheath protein FI